MALRACEPFIITVSFFVYIIVYKTTTGPDRVNFIIVLKRVRVSTDPLPRIRALATSH